MEENDFNNTENLEPEKQPACKTLKLTTVINGAAVCVLAFLVLITVLAKTGYLRIGKSKLSAEQQEINDRFGEVYNHLDSFYIGELSNDEMLDAALKSYVNAVGDPYTEYMPKTKAEGFINGDYGNKSGIGVRIFQSTEPNGIYVKYVFPSSPADKAGILSNDIIVAVNNTVISNDNYSDAIDMISGEEGTTVTLTVMRGDEAKIFSVVRGSYTVSPIEYRLLEGEDGIAYIRIDGVSSDSAAELKKAIEALKEKGAKAYIFDVRDDGGGYLNEVTSMLDMLLPEGPIVRYTHKGEDRQRVSTSDASVIVSAPMAVLINGNTASAAELFAAALRDYKLATLIGETTYGKGVIQTLYKLENGDYLKITTGEYFPPYSDNFHGVGVKPNITVSLPDGKHYYQLSEKDDTQLQAAVTELKNKLSQD